MYSYSATLKEGVTQPLVVSLSEAKDHLNITHDYQDDLINSYRDVAIEIAENYTQRSLKIREVTATASKFEQNHLYMKGPFLTETVITYKDANNQVQTLAATSYRTTYRQGNAYLYFEDFKNLPDVYDASDAVTISFEIGYDDESKIPLPFKQAIRLLIGSMYENRIDKVDRLPTWFQSLLRPYRRW